MSSFHRKLQAALTEGEWLEPSPWDRHEADRDSKHLLNKLEHAHEESLEGRWRDGPNPVVYVSSPEQGDALIHVRDTTVGELRELLFEIPDVDVLRADEFTCFYDVNEFRAALATGDAQELTMTVEQLRKHFRV